MERFQELVAAVSRPGALALALAALVATGVGATASHAQHQHGTPEGWKFGLPTGDAAKGREAFAKFECYKCHEVKGETFPSTPDKENVGPELSAMAPLHDVEYFAESIVNPRKAVEKGKMPSFNDSMTVQELVDLVAYLKSLKAPRAAPAHMRH